MKSNWIPVQPANVPQTKQSEIERKIKELIDWYDDNATRKEDNYIKAKLKSVIDMAANIESSEDILFIEEIVNTLLNIIKLQRDVIRELEYESEISPINAAPQHNYVSPYVAPVEGFTNDEQIKSEFINFMVYGTEKKRSSFTANDYILRVQNLWRSFYADYEAGELPNELSESVIQEEIRPEFPLLNAYNYIEELNCYVSMKIASAGDNRRNWTNVRAALNTFGKALYKDEYEKKKLERPQTSSKDFSKYLFEGKTYGKSRLVLAVVKKYVEDHHPTTFDELESAFPSSIQGSLGVVRRIEDVSNKYKGIGGVKRYFVDDVICLASGEQVIVCTQWGTNIDRFIEHAMNKLDCKIQKA